jgi:GT2 family glycosyltransferase
MSKKTKVGVIVVGWNNHNILDECFESIRNQTYDSIETIYWDNDSADNSVEHVAKTFPWVTIIESEKNIGFAAANNRAIERFQKDPEIAYVLLLNSDARIDRHWVEAMVSFAKTKPQVALLQGKTLDYYDHEVIDSNFVYVAQNGQATQGKWRRLDAGADHPLRVYGVNAAACMVSRKFIERQPFKNLFDERFFMYLEDVDVAARAVVTGWDNYFVPDAIAYHMGSASSGKNPGYSLYMTYRNNLAMLVKNYPSGTVFKLLPRMFRSDISTVKRLLGKGNKNGAYKLILGRVVGFFRLPLYIVPAFKVSRRRSIDKAYLWKLMARGY